MYSLSLANVYNTNTTYVDVGDCALIIMPTDRDILLFVLHFRNIFNIPGGRNFV